MHQSSKGYHAHKLARIGPYGMNCPCCGPAPGKVRKIYLKLWKKREKAISRKEYLKEL